MTDDRDWAVWSARQAQRIETALEHHLDNDTAVEVAHRAPAELRQAMRYAVLGGGKRLRPQLVLAAYAAVSGDMTDEGPGAAAALRAACAVELIHAYSLVHDDLPCMDNDVLRRGQPTVHVRFGEAKALLAGDALQALAFEVLTPLDGSIEPAVQAQLCALLARAAGCAGMAGGQAIDLASVGQLLTESQLRTMHGLKTGALLQASVVMGACCAGADSSVLKALRSYGSAIGLAFQVVDDVLDVTAESVTLGKTAGKDAAQAKPTYVSVLGLQAAQQVAAQLQQQALAALKTCALVDPRPLQTLAQSLVQRAS